MDLIKNIKIHKKYICKIMTGKINLKTNKIKIRYIKFKNNFINRKFFLLINILVNLKVKMFKR
jgi:hypothetical protein